VGKLKAVHIGIVHHLTGFSRLVKTTVTIHCPSGNILELAINEDEKATKGARQCDDNTLAGKMLSTRLESRETLSFYEQELECSDDVHVSGAERS
jgi:hypothetical protein